MDIQHILSRLTGGTRDERNQAKKDIERYWHQRSTAKDRDATMRALALALMDAYKTIELPEYKQAVLSALRLPQWFLKDEELMCAQDLILRALEDSDGQVRYQALFVLEYHIMHLRVSGGDWHGRKPKNADAMMTLHRSVLIKLFDRLVDMQNRSMPREVKKMDAPPFMDELPPSVFKSAHMALHRVVRSPFWMELLHASGRYPDEVLLAFAPVHEPVDYDPHSQEGESFAKEECVCKDCIAIRGLIAQKRGAIETKIRTALTYYGLDKDMPFEELVQWIKEEHDMSPTQKFAKKATAHTDTMEEAQALLDMFVEMWNYFPHDRLGGKCPHELAIAEQKEMDDFDAYRKQDTTKPATPATLERMRAYALRLCGKALDELDVHTGAYLATIEERLKHNGVLESEGIFLELMSRLADETKIVSKKEGTSPLSVFNSFVRAFQILTHHTPYHDDSGYTTEFIRSVQETKYEYGMKKPESFEQYTLLSLVAHEALDRLWEEQQQALRKEKQEAEKRWKDMGLDNDKDPWMEKYYRVDNRFYSVAHHILDWYLQLEPVQAYKKSANKLAVIAFYLTKLINETVYKNYVSPFDEGLIASFGGWKNKSSLTHMRYSAVQNLLYSVHDPDLLCYDPANVPKGWRKNLASLAPDFV